MMKKLTVALLAVIICLSFAAFSAGAATESLTEVPKGYTGVYTIEDLYCIRNNLSGSYILMNDIDLTEATAKGGDWDFGGKGWNPIGSNDEYDDLEFSGIFNGNGHSITGMRIEVTKTPSDAGACIYYGLFSFVSGEVENLTLTGEITSSITKQKTIFAGGIAARSSGDIRNCNVKVSVNVKNDCSDSQTFYDVYAGGIVGWNIGDISHCCNLADVYAYVNSGYNIAQSFYYSNAYAGGICGYDDGSGHIYASYNTGNITTENKAYDAKSYGGGICGYGGRSTSGYIENCYNTGNVSTRTGNFTIYNSTFATGGIVYYYAGDIVNCYNAGTVTGITNYAISSSPAEKCYYLSGTGEDSSGATSLTAAQMKLKAMYSNWDFEKVWTIEGRTDYPYPELRYMPHYSANEIPLHEHNYSAVRTEPTHTAEGKVVYTCKSCGDSYTEKLAKLEGHSYCKTVEKDSTCTSEGYVLYSCECGDTYTEKKEKLSHNFTEKIIDNAHLVSAATKESPAVYRYDCSVCDTISEDLTFTYGEKIGPLGKTDSITAAQNTSAIKLTWNEVETATVYRVYRKNNGSWVKLADINTNTYTISKLSAGTKYSFAVKAGRLYDGKIEWASGYTTTDTATKTVMTSVTATQNTSAIKLSWKACPGATGYRIYYMSGGAWKVSVSSTTATSYTYNNLRAGAKYTFAIRPYIKNGSSVIWTNYTEFMTATKPANVTAKASSPSAGKITLTWNAVNGADGYQVYYKSNNGAYKLYNIYSTVQKLTFSNLNPNTTFTFAVRAGIRTSGGNIYGGYITSSIKPKSNALTDAKATQLWLEAYDVYYNWASWGLYDNNIDKSRPVYFDGTGTLPYYPIVDHSFDSKADLRAYLYNYFDGVITEEILSWIYEYKGVMYTRMPTGRGIEPEMQSIVVKKQASTYAEVYITFVRSSGEQETFVQKMSLVNGKWIFAEKFYNRPKYDY